MEKQTGARCWQRYGNILNVDTTGASAATVKPEGLSYAEFLPQRRLQKDLKSMEKYRAKITEAGNRTCVDPAVIAGIISRESHAGKVLDDGWGDHRNVFGLMQVDKRYHKIEGSWDSMEHLTQAAEILKGFTEEMQNKFPTWTKEQQLKAAISAYNAEAKNIRTYDGIDTGTTHNDYANDVVARATFFKRNGY